MQSTKNYQLVKQELTDKADITQISGNWDKIDTEMKRLSDEKFDKAGGTIAGATTFQKGVNVQNGATIDTLNVEEVAIGKNLTVTGVVTANEAVKANKGITVKGGATVDSLTVEWATNTDTLNVKGSSTFGADVEVSGRVLTDNVRAKGQSLSVGVTTTESELIGIISQSVGGTTPRISVTHHPVADSNDKSIVTTNWVRNLKATKDTFGLVKVATPDVAIDPDADDAAITPATYHDVSDFRHKNTAYNVGDKVECMFNHELWLECTKAGTTCADPLDTRNVTHGQVLTDGEVEWTVRTHIVTVNGIVPDATGNIEIDSGGVKTVDGVAPDGNGNVALGLHTVAKSGNYNDLNNRPNLHSVATSGDYNALINKPAIPATPNAYVTHSWRSGFNWYRKWSNNIIEQGGRVPTNGSIQTPIALHLPFTDVNYATVVSGVKEGGYEGTVPTSSSKTLSSFKAYHGTGCQGVEWYAHGK